MTQEERKTLLIDLCDRLPHGVKIMFSHNVFCWDREQTLNEIAKCDDGEYAVNGWGIHGIKPYLRSMSSMTEEEKEIMRSYGFELILYDTGVIGFANIGCIDEVSFRCMEKFLNSHHFDYRGLIPMGLAFKAPEDMYKTE